MLSANIGEPKRPHLRTLHTAGAIHIGSRNCIRLASDQHDAAFAHYRALKAPEAIDHRSPDNAAGYHQNMSESTNNIGRVTREGSSRSAARRSSFQGETPNFAYSARILPKQASAENKRQ